VIGRPHRVALAVGEPHEARLLGILEDPAFQVAGRGVTVSRFCSSVREVREAIEHTEAVDAILLSSTLQALPVATVREIVQSRRPLVLLVPDAAMSRWTDELGVPVAGLSATSAELAAALGLALLDQRPAHQRPRRGRARDVRAPSASATTPAHRARAVSGTHRCEVVTVTSAEAPEGKTSAVAVPLAYALGHVAPTVLLDVNSRGSGVEFHLAVDPAHGLPELGRRALHPDGSWHLDFEDEDAWRMALEAELQPMGSADQGRVGCGISVPSYRQYLTEQVLERAVATLRRSRRFVVLDGSGGGWLPGDAALDRAALLLADRLLVVVRPDEEGIQRARRLLASWPRRDRIGLVLNHLGLPGTGESVGSIEYVLDAPVVAALPFDARHVAAARAHHHPVVCEPGARLSEPILALAMRLAGGGSIRLPAAPAVLSPSPWWRRLPLAAASLVR
jgi:hypothetical protein